MSTAIVVGSGPNGLAAAVRLAQAGLDVTVLEANDTIGGGTRSAEMIVPGLVHDHCSAVHPVAAASPIVTELGLEHHGLRWLRPAIDCVHPLDDGAAGTLYRSISDTREALGDDGARWERLAKLFTSNFDGLFSDVTQPMLRLPDHPVLTARFGLAALMPATVLARLFRGDEARALFAGIAAHTYYRLDRPMTSAVALMLLAAGHEHGWVVAERGSQSIADAMVAELERHGARIETGHRVTSATELSAAQVVMLDVAPSIAADIMGDQLPPSVRRAYRRFRHGPGAFKVDFAIEVAFHGEYLKHAAQERSTSWHVR